MTDRPAFLYITEDGPVMRVWADGTTSGFPPGKLVSNIGAIVDRAYSAGYFDGVSTSGKRRPAFSLRGFWARVLGR